MGDTFKKRQKAITRREKQQKKAARRMERRLERSKVAGQLEQESPRGTEIGSTSAAGTE
jgi:hypothetical protein